MLVKFRSMHVALSGILKYVGFLMRLFRLMDCKTHKNYVENYLMILHSNHPLRYNYHTCLIKYQLPSLCGSNCYL